MSTTIKGHVDKVGPYKSGKNQKGEWSLQYVTVDGKDIKVWCRPDLSSTKGKSIRIYEVDNNELKADTGSIVVDEETPTSSEPPKSPPPTSSKPTIDEYFRVLDKVIAHVANTMGTSNLDAVASVVNGTMVSFAKGGFVVPEEKVPF